MLVDCPTLDKVGSMYLYKLFIINPPIPIRICLLHHLPQLTRGQPLSEVGHDLRKLFRGDISIAVLIEYFESLAYLFFTVRILELTAHHLLRTKHLQWLRETKEDTSQTRTVRNSLKSIVPFPSTSTSLIMSCSSVSEGFWPSERITTPSSFVVMVPSPSISSR